MRPSGDENNPCQKRSVTGPGRTDFNLIGDILHHGFYFDKKISLAPQAGCSKTFKKRKGDNF
jgi:hypothetical protein